MLRWRGVADIPADWTTQHPTGSVVTIGVFDGVHRGHQRIIRRTVETARRCGAPAVVVTFEPHPSEVVRPGSHPAVLSTQKFRAELLEGLGVDAILVLEFSLELSRKTPTEFVRDVLVEALRTRAVVVGENFRYGHRAAGDLTSLTAEGERWGFDVEGVSLKVVEPGGRVFSSTVVRRDVAEGDVAAARRLLGRPHRVEGVVVRGARRGHDLGYPTANLECPPHTAIPADGVYAGWLVVDVHTGHQASLPAAISVGTNPMFGGTVRQVEAYALDRDDLDLYGTHVAVEFTERVREQRNFDSVEALLDRMAEDIKEIRELLDTE